MATPFAEPAALATLRAEASGAGDQRLQVVAAAVGALWSAVEGLHAANEASHAALAFFFICGYFRDASRYALIPCMITSIVFLSFAMVLSFMSIINVILNGNSYVIRGIHGGNLFFYLLC